jgi:hypothetical protein
VVRLKFKKDYSIEWSEECEADSFEEAEIILDKLADETANSDCLDIYKSFDVEVINDEN